MEVFDYWGWVAIAIPLLMALVFFAAGLRSKDVSQAQEPGHPGKTALEQGLDKSRQKFWQPLTALFRKGGGLSQDILEEVEEILYSADLGPKLTNLIIRQLKEQVGKEGYGLQELKGFLREMIISKMTTPSSGEQWSLDSRDKLQTIMFVGINGVGKTTSMGKLAVKLVQSGSKVVVGACDTFRMAATEQLAVWAERAGCEIVQAKMGADPSGVAYDTLRRAQEVGADYCLIDTAGRLHTKSNLMDELKKTKRVLQKLDPRAPEHIWLVVDAVTGQNAIRQAEEFHRALQLTGLIFTKCDGSSKAGAAVSIVENLQVPITFIGVGEGVNDLQQFNVEQYVDAMLLY